MDKKIGYLSYNYDNNRISVIDRMDLFISDGLHCGECFEVFINDEWKADRLEMAWDKNWYLVYAKLKGDQLEGLKVRF